MKKYYQGIVSVVLVLCFPIQFYGQTNTKSIPVEIQQNLPDTQKLRILTELSRNNEDENLEDYYYNLLNEIITKLYIHPEKWNKNEATVRIMGTATNNMAYHLSIKGFTDSSIFFHTKSLNISKQLKDANGTAISYSNIAQIYQDMGNENEAAKYYFLSLKTMENDVDENNKVKNPEGIGIGLNNIGLFFSDNNDVASALKYLNESMKYRILANDSAGIATTLTNLGYLNYKFGDIASKDTTKSKEQGYKKAIDYFNRALAIRKQINDELGASGVLVSFGHLFFADNKFDDALENYFQALEIRGKRGYKDGVANTLLSISKVYLKKNDFNQVKKYATEAYNIGKELKHPSTVQLSAELLYQAYKGLGDETKALQMFELSIKLKDSLVSIQNVQEITRQQYKYDYEQKSAADSLFFAKEKQIKEIEIAQQKTEIKAKRTQLYFLFFGIAVVILFAGFIYNRFKTTKKQNLVIEKQKKDVEFAHHLLEEKNKEIVDSIQYAKRIQSAILPQNKLVKEYLPESFVLYKPKDIVAGDFYWMNHTNGIILFAVADCTGHGVPGALVSVVCNYGLNRSVREFGLTHPSEILDKTRDLVVQEFEKSEDDVKDGMDIALCSLQFNTESSALLEYAGANNPLWIIRKTDENYELIEYKADKQPIGKYDNHTPYTNHTIHLIKGDSLYIFSDGYVDQFGGEKGKKFRAKSLRELLLSIQDKSIESQREIINNTFETWKGDLEQVDDVCIIGVRI